MIATISDPELWQQEEGAVLVQLARHVEALSEPRSLLDVGAGSGRIAHHFQGLLNRVCLVEPDATRLGRLEPDLWSPHVSVVPNLKVAALQAPFDVVVISHVIQHISALDACQLVGESTRLCRVGGLVYLATSLARGRSHQYYMAVLHGGTWRERRITERRFERHATKPELGFLPVHFFPVDYLCSQLRSIGVEPEVIEPFHCVRSRLHGTGKSRFRDIAIIGRRT